MGVGLIVPYKDPVKAREAERRYYWRNREKRLARFREKYHALSEEEREVRLARCREYGRRKWAEDPAVREASRIRKRGYREVSRAYDRRRYHGDVNFRLAHILRRRLKAALCGEAKRGSAVEDLGCPIGALKAWLMYQFEDGMSWDNYGEWHIDHVLPLASFDLIDREQLLKACTWQNLQPLWAKDNQSKGARI